MIVNPNKIVRILYLLMVILFISYAVAEEKPKKTELMDKIKYYFQPQYVHTKIVSSDNILLNYQQHLVNAKVYLQKKNWEKCSDECDFILHQFSKNPDALRIKGDIYFYKNLYLQAIWYYQQSIDSNETPETWISLARVYNELQMYKESTFAWGKVLTKHIQSGDERIVCYELGLVYLRLNQIEKAGEQFRRCHNISSNSPKEIFDISHNVNDQILAKQIEFTNNSNKKQFSK